MTDIRPIDANVLKKALEVTPYNDIDDLVRTEKLIDNAPTVEPHYVSDLPDDVVKTLQTLVIDYSEGLAIFERKRPQGEYVDISKLRLMTVEECAGHTIDYALGWKACIEWIKKGGAE